MALDNVRCLVDLKIASSQGDLKIEKMVDLKIRRNLNDCFISIPPPFTVDSTSYTADSTAFTADRTIL